MSMRALERGITKHIAAEQRRICSREGWDFPIEFSDRQQRVSSTIENGLFFHHSNHCFVFARD